MNRQHRSTISVAMAAVVFATGCHPQQPFFFSGKDHAGGGLQHYVDVASDIEYPNVNVRTLDEVTHAQSPLTIANADDFDIWDVTLEEVTRITLANSQVIRQLGGRILDQTNISSSSPETITNNPGGVLSTYDPSLVASGNGVGNGNQFSGTGAEAALSEFDAVIDSSIIWQKNDRPQNFDIPIGGGASLFAPQFQQDLSNFTVGITKNTADGTRFEFRNNTNYDANTNGGRIAPSEWGTNLEAGFSRPLLQGAGTQYNRIAGPQDFATQAAGAPNQIDGVLIARIREDVTLAQFETGVVNLMRDVEDAYWELYFAYRDLEAQKVGRDSALETWRKVKALQRVGSLGGEADREAQSRSQYYLFRAQVEQRLTFLFRVENRLRYMMGLPASDGRLIRPSDQPTVARVDFDWSSVHVESLARRPELRQQKWQIKRRELELIAAKNNLMPRLDATGRYRWLGAGDQLIDSSRNNIEVFQPGSDAWSVLTEGDFQEWELGLQFSMPIGFRSALSGVRHQQLLLAKERAVLQDLELEVSHQLSDAIRDIDLNYGQTQTFFNRLVAAQDEVDAVEAVYRQGRVTLDQLLDAQRRRSEAESSYHRSLADYNRAIMRAHFRKGSLLEYNGVYLSEGPWANKAQFDALRRARQRNAQHRIDYGLTAPAVISRGPIPQQQGYEKVETPEPVEADAVEDGTIILPEAEGIDPLPEPQQSDGNAEGPAAQAGSASQDRQSPLLPLPATSDSQAGSGQSPANAALAAATRSDHDRALSAPPATAAPVQHTSYQSPTQPQLRAWIDATTRGLPPIQRNRQTPAAHEPQADHTPAEAAADTAVRPGPER